MTGGGGIGVGGGDWAETDKSTDCSTNPATNYYYVEVWSIQPLGGPIDQEYTLTITGKNFLPERPPGGSGGWSDWAGTKTLPQAQDDPAGPDPYTRSYVCRFTLAMTATVSGSPTVVTYVKKTPATRLDDSTLLCTRPQFKVPAGDHTASSGETVPGPVEEANGTAISF